VKNASGILQGNLLLQTCVQRRSFGLAEGESIPSRGTTSVWYDVVMNMSEPVDWVNKPFLGYTVNAEFSADNVEKLDKLNKEIQAAFGTAVFCMPGTSLHITLFDWVSPLLDYKGRDKKKLFAWKGLIAAIHACSFFTIVFQI